MNHLSACEIISVICWSIKVSMSLGDSVGHCKSERVDATQLGLSVIN